MFTPRKSKHAFEDSAENLRTALRGLRDAGTEVGQIVCEAGDQSAEALDGAADELRRAGQRFAAAARAAGSDGLDAAAAQLRELSRELSPPKKRRWLW